MTMNAKPPGDSSRSKTPAEIWLSNSADAVASSQQPNVQIKLIQELREAVFCMCEQTALCSTSAWEEAHGGLRKTSGKSLGRQVFPHGNCKPSSPGQQFWTAFPRLSRGGRTKQAWPSTPASHEGVNTRMCANRHWTSFKRLPVDKTLRAGGVMLPIRAFLTAVAAGEVIRNNCRISASKIKGLQPTNTGKLYQFVE